LSGNSEIQRGNSEFSDLPSGSTDVLGGKLGLNQAKASAIGVPPRWHDNCQMEIILKIMEMK
jgi:hypothetical protein